MQVRRLGEAPVEEFHRLRTHILMDAGEMGSRNLSVTRVEVPPGTEQRLHTDAEAEQVYVVVSGSGRMAVAGDSQDLSEGDLILIPPATDHELANAGNDAFALISIQSPAVSVAELFGGQMAEVAGYDDDEEY